ncbi:hypothetical protein FVA74_00585 [Salinibacterium sp. dk2585]|uniref:hypothetical protein n=1 Tax=unclassified Salinibacterium TaxID=2632331 RepID=UPI0011C24BA9|nr:MULTISPECIES: hypothetical protein [unclassified Salinibacterium]QEE60223.1 hypothetical protein FVA74_00585 [Salinibacterium sp. dk2585]TXK55295.1 hypothetical protein FVP63_00730 [Salinibacterium sp. dk5596]
MVDLERARAAVTDAVGRLSAAGVPDEALAEFTPQRRKLGITLSPRMKPTGRAWRLGVFLLDTGGTLYAAGHSTRAVEPGRSNYQSISGEERRMHRAAAHRSYPEGTVVNFGSSVLELTEEGLAAASGPLFISDGRLLVRWNPTADVTTAPEFEAYLRERVELLLSPPAGSTE